MHDYTVETVNLNIPLIKQRRTRLESYTIPGLINFCHSYFIFKMAWH